VKYLDIKRKRDFRRQRWQFIAVLVTITLGVMLFAASYDAYRNLFASYNGTYDRLGFADITITGPDDGFATTLAATDGVATTEVRLQADVPFRVNGDVFVGRVVTMPPDQEPEINKLDIVDGDYLSVSQPDGVVVETHMADEFGLSVGDPIEILAGNDWIEVQAIGVAVSAEYLWPAPSTQNFSPCPAPSASSSLRMLRSKRCRGRRPRTRCSLSTKMVPIAPPPMQPSPAPPTARVPPM
jgi:putative ABC transport system permease protein